MGLGLGASLSKTGLATPGIVTDSLVLKHNYAAGGVVPVSDGSAFFDGTDDYIAIGNVSNLNFTTGSFSVGAWIKTSASGSNDGIICKDLKWQFMMDSSNKLHLALLDTSGTNPNVSSATSINTGEWTHVAGVRHVADDKLYVYINGTLDGSVTDTTDETIASSATVDIGRRADSGEFFNGYICNVGVWSAVLTQAQIKSIMWKNYAGLDSSETTNLVSWWNLSANANDDHGSNNGTLS
jgi:hypothetical protein